MYGSAERIEIKIAAPSGGPAFRDKPPTFGDADQIEALEIINGDRPYCFQCLDLLETGTLDDIGETCMKACTGFYVPGAAMESRWRKYADIEGC